MTKSQLYLAGDRESYTMETMVNRVIYWWTRYEGKRTEDGKDFSASDVRELENRLSILSMHPDKFRWNRPDMTGLMLGDDEEEEP